MSEESVTNKGLRRGGYEPLNIFNFYIENILKILKKVLMTGNGNESCCFEDFTVWK